MKKLTIALIVLAILACSVFALTACNKEEPTTDPFAYDLSKMEVGDEIPVYPGFSFDYVPEDGNIVHIDSITATLVAKNVINEGDTVEGDFRPYTISVSVKGSTSQTLAGRTITVICSTNQLGIVPFGAISSDGTFSITHQTSISFSEVRLHFRTISVA